MKVEFPDSIYTIITFFVSVAMANKNDAKRLRIDFRTSLREENALNALLRISSFSLF